GLKPFEQMTRVVDLLEHSVYEHGSLRLEGDRISFTLRNPPLRTGAFESIRLLWDGTVVAPATASLAAGSQSPQYLGSISRNAPISLPVGRRSVFSFPRIGEINGEHAVRLELQSVAIPPRVWFEFSDHVQLPAAP
ncbi:MAG: hypothetical protein L3K17_08335, partial [Thermoplasmata archaeon]|nr:hypothetical protein [Thermoplasmata archaeon]